MRNFSLGQSIIVLFGTIFLLGLIVFAALDLSSALTVLIFFVAVILGYRYYVLSIWFLVFGILFPISLARIEGFNLKLLDVAIILSLIVSVLRMLASPRETQPKRRYPIYYIFGLVFLVCANVCSLLVSPDFSTALTYTIESIEAFFVTIVIAAYITRSDKYLRHFMWATVVLSVPAILDAIIILSNPEFVASIGYRTEIGTYNSYARLRGYHPFAFGYILSFGLVFAVAFLLSQTKEERKKMLNSAKNWFLVAASVVILGGVVGTLVRTWFVGIVAGIMFLVFLWKSTLIPAVLFLAMIGLVIFTFVLVSPNTDFQMDNSSSQLAAGIDRLGQSGAAIGIRLDVWQSAWELYRSSLLTGVGGNNAKVDVNVWYASEADIDNGYLQILFELGILGFAGVMTLLGGSLFQILRARKPENREHLDLSIAYGLSMGLVVLITSLFTWNIWGQGSSPAVITGLIIHLNVMYFQRIREDNRLPEAVEMPNPLMPGARVFSTADVATSISVSTANRSHNSAR